MISKITSVIDLFRKGVVVANPTAWKKGQVTVNTLATVLVAAIGVAKAFGYEIPITETEANTLATAVLIIVGLFNNVATVVSTDKVGLPSKDTLQTKTNPTGRFLGQSD